MIKVSIATLIFCIYTPTQARNQLGTSFATVAQIFWTLSKSFKLCPKHFSRGGETKNFCILSVFVTGLHHH